MAMRMIGAEELQGKVRRIFERLNVPPGDAAIVAEHLVEADLRGVHSHGVIRVPNYVQRIGEGKVNPRPNIRIVRDEGGQVVMDGDFGLGQLTAYRANEVAIERGKQHGMAGVALRRSTHAGAMAFYPIRASRHGLIGLAITNAGMNMTPTGGTQKLVGNNPFAMGVPTNKDWSMVLDMATSVVAGGKLDVARAKGESIPLGWARDKDGNPTTDPAAARQGALEPVGGPKGYGMAIMLDVLAGVLSGGRFGGMLGDETGRGGMAQYFQTIDVERYMPLAEFKQRMDALIDQIHASQKSPGVKRIFVAGEIEHDLQTERLRDGIPLADAVLDALDKAAAELGA
ncbi:MAG: Ldh family oxidoreductase [Chloroflexi bacterium]|nr:Ldh family oxidoreductase [Chloroflexota bacterium]